MRSFSYRALFSLSFVVLLALPMVISLFQPTEKISRVENRRLAPVPRVESFTALVSDFPGQFEEYVDDHFARRSEVVRLHSYVLFKFFKVPVTNMVTIGIEDWLFFNGDNGIYDYLGRFRYTPDQLQRASLLLEDRKNYLAAHGIRYLFLPVPNKEEVYQEFLPSALRKQSGESKYSQIVGAIDSYSKFTDYLDTRELLLANKDNQLYLRTDSHWNHHGAFLTHSAIITKVQEWFQDITLISPLEEINWVKDFSGDLARLINLHGVIVEIAPDLMIDKKKTSREDPSTLPPGKNLKTVFIHDSFGNFLAPYFRRQFAETIFVTKKNFEGAKEMILTEKPDLVIDQRVGRNLDKALVPDPELEQFILGRYFQKHPSPLQIFEEKKLQNYVTPVGSLHMPLKSTAGAKKPDVAALRLNSKTKTKILLCYRDKEQPLQRHHCQERGLQEGENRLYFRLYGPGGEGILDIRKTKAKSELDYKELVVTGAGS